jgi:hypothetical protein
MRRGYTSGDALAHNNVGGVGNPACEPAMLDRMFPGVGDDESRCRKQAEILIAPIENAWDEIWTEIARIYVYGSRSEI